MFEAVGVTPFEERLYTELVDRPWATVADLQEATEASGEQVREALRRMQALGLVSRTTDEPPRLVPAPPDVAVEALVARNRERIERARAGAASLMSRYLDAAQERGSASLVELTHGRAAVRQRFQQLTHGTRDELLVLDTPPYAVAHDEIEAPRDLLEGGARLRTIYDTAALEIPGGAEHVRALQSLGEDARLLPDLPLKLAISDRRVALVPLNPDQSIMESSALVHPCALLDALVALFDQLWQRAVPLRLSAPDPLPEHPDGLDELERELLQLLVTGQQDRAIARQLEVTERTVGRRVARLMERADARSRFQLGWQAARRDWV